MATPLGVAMILLSEHSEISAFGMKICKHLTLLGR